MGRKIHAKGKEKQIKEKRRLEAPKFFRICPKCGSPMIEKMGRFGRFYACTAFPKCKHTESLESEKLGIKCPKCKEGDIVVKKTKRGKIFYGCGRFPKCDFATWDKPINEFCEKCNSILIETKHKQVKCSNKECNYIKSKKS